MGRKSKRWETMDKGNVSLDKLMLQYEAFKRTEAKTPKTIEWYNQSLHLLNEFLKQNGYSNLLKDLSLELVRTYILYLQKRQRFVDHPYVPTQEEKLSPATVENHVRAIRAFFSWLYREGYTEEHILQRLKLPKVPLILIEDIYPVSAETSEVRRSPLCADTGRETFPCYGREPRSCNQGFLQLAVSRGLH